ncbi:hypothetical protein ACMFMF_006948 [Clarireedia jacksonii]
MTRSYATHLPRANIISHPNDPEVIGCIKGLESGQTVDEYVDKTVRESLRLGGTLVEAGDTSAVALWELPSGGASALQGSHGPEDINVAAVKKEWKEVVQRAKKQHIGLETKSSQIRQHYVLDFLGRNPHVPKVPGAISAVVAPFLNRAKQDQHSVWLEATSPNVVPLYEHFGFKIVEEITVGAGRFDEDGQTKDGGSGVKAWLMLIDNHGAGAAC